MKSCIMEIYLTAFKEAFLETLNWTLDSITFNVSWFENYFWGLVAISIVVWSLEILFPWRKSQSVIRRDFWLDGFYMFFNFFIFACFESAPQTTYSWIWNIRFERLVTHLTCDPRRGNKWFVLFRGNKLFVDNKYI